MGMSDAPTTTPAAPATKKALKCGAFIVRTKKLSQMTYAEFMQPLKRCTGSGEYMVVVGGVGPRLDIYGPLCLAHAKVHAGAYDASVPTAIIAAVPGSEDVRTNLAFRKKMARDSKMFHAMANTKAARARVAA